MASTSQPDEQSKDTQKVDATEHAEGNEKKLHTTALYFDIKETQWPIVYHPEYNISFFGLQKLHPFDAGKWGRVYGFLKEDGMIRDDTSVRPLEATQDDLLVVHTLSYLKSLKLTDILEGIPEWSGNVAMIMEVPPVALLPNFIVQRKALKPFRLHTGGSILAGKLAIERGWAINIGGGFHHCSSKRGGGFCAYADISLLIKFMFERIPDQVKTAMIIDLDAHQGNGHERDFMGDEKVYIMDVYNRQIYPHDGFAKRGIRKKVELESFTEDREYLTKVNQYVNQSLNEFKPDVVVYNAGTDILEGDGLGCLSISAMGVIERDQIVFESVRKRNIPIVMVTSGGYQRSNARIIADSILNLHQRGLINCEEALSAPPPETAAPKSSIPRSESDGGLWARFKRSASSRCSTMTRSQTQEAISPMQNGTQSDSQEDMPQQL